MCLTHFTDQVLLADTGENHDAHFVLRLTVRKDMVFDSKNDIKLVLEKIVACITIHIQMLRPQTDIYG